jgi:HD-GYP domain-containing protein (c-di-GMP phosphodiesterase class II)
MTGKSTEVTDVRYAELLAEAEQALADPDVERSGAADTLRRLVEECKHVHRETMDTRRTLGMKVMELEREKAQAESDLESLTSIGNALSLEKDSNTLFRKILALGKKITGSDAGSIFLVEEGEDGTPWLRFKYSNTFSKDLPYEEQLMPLDTNSIAGYVAATGKVLNIPDVYELGADDPVVFNKYFDETFNYRCKSMLVVPMRNHYDKIIGLIQLINCKERDDLPDSAEAWTVRLESMRDFEELVIPYPERYELLLQAVASQAAIALENNRMIRQIEEQFEQFVRASVTAIESRDPATTGHSFRVAQMCVNMAKAVNAAHTGPFADLHFSPSELRELEYSGLLHDFGKVYIDPAVYVKDKKLYDKDFANLSLKISYLYTVFELEQCRNSAAGHGSYDDLPEEYSTRLTRLREILAAVTELNEPTVMEEDPEEMLTGIREFSERYPFHDLADQTLKLLTEYEYKNLKIPRGTLNDEEREVIQSHVDHTYTFVSKIPWPDDLRDIPNIAHKHHEKLDGSGYPLGLKGYDHIPIGARMMAIADIFDALAASDRPYKKAVPLEKCHDILREEAERGQLDPELVELFVTSKSYRTDAD